MFRQLFFDEPLIVRSPGRINIIGEHTDYNEGFVLPAAIDKYATVAVSKRTDDRVHLHAAGFHESFETELSCIKPTGNWATYILGVADQLLKRGYAIGGFNLVVDGDVPVGAGMSSSAAVECAAVFALNELFDLGIGRMEMVKIAQQAEHEFAGVQCGIMDMFASMFGRKDQVIRIDCRSLEHEYIPLQLEGYKLVLLNTNVKHSLASSEYNVRRQQCEYGVSLIQAHHPEIKSLRDATVQMLDDHVALRDALVYRRCRYVVGEVRRLLDACEDLQNGNLAALGRKMFQTHEGLSRDYEVSCKELDFLVDAVKEHPAVLGARMMGGGFGGCTINLVKEDAIEPLVEKLMQSYQQSMHLELSAYIVQTGNGTERITNKVRERA